MRVLGVHVGRQRATASHPTNNPHDGNDRKSQSPQPLAPAQNSHTRAARSICRIRKPLRIAIGVLLIFFGIFGFLPVLGFWMVPLGLLVLSHDFAWPRRQRRRLAVWWERRQRRNGSQAKDR